MWLLFCERNFCCLIYPIALNRLPAQAFWCPAFHFGCGRGHCWRRAGWFDGRRGLVAQGHRVHVFDRMPSAGRKFCWLDAVVLNLTHSEPMNQFMGRYGTGAESLVPILEVLTIRRCVPGAASLGIDTFVGSSGRVFPSDMKAAPLLRARLHRLRHPVSGCGAVFHHRHRWLGWSDGADGV